MRWVAVGFLVSFAFTGLPASAAPDVVVRSKLDPAEGVVVGQPVRLLIDVLFPGAMPHPPRVRVGDTPGAQILRFETQAVTMRDRIDGQDYVGQEFEFAVFPRRGGSLAIPGADVTLLDRSGDPAGAAKGESLRLDVSVPPGIDASGPVLAAGKVTAVQTWTPDPAAALRPGDALRRTIRRQAAGVPALGMADFTFAAPDGVSVYADAPEAQDRVNRGDVEGSRLDQVTYVFEKPGVYELPELTQPWWDLASKSAHSETFPGARVTVVAGSSTAASQVATRRPAMSWWTRVAIATVVLVVASIGWSAWPSARRTVHAWRARRAASPDAARRRLRDVARTGDAAETDTALKEWLRRLPAEELDRIRADEELSRLIESLERTVYGSDDAAWSQALGSRLSVVVSSAAAAMFRARPRRPPALPPLNPAVRLRAGS